MLKTIRRIDIKRLLLTHADLLVLILIGVLICQTWFKPDYVIAGVDYFPFVFPIDALKQNLFIWDHYGFGVDLTQHTPGHALVLGMKSFFYLFGFSISLIERIWWTLWFVLPAVSMYFLSSLVLKNDRIGRFAASFFYMVNMFVVRDAWYAVAVWAYSLTPFLLAVLIKGFESVSNNKSTRSYILLFSIASVGLSYLSLNPAVLAVSLIALGVYTIFHLIFNCSNDGERLRVTKFFSLCVILSILLNLWWIAPLYVQIYETKTTAVVAEVSLDKIAAAMVRNQFVNVFRLTTDWPFFSEEYSLYSSNFMENPLLIAAVFIPSLLVFTAPLFREFRKNKFLIYSLLFLIPLLFIVKGIQPPFDGLYRWIYASVPFFWIFREPASKFFLIIVGLYAVLIGFSISKLCEKLRQFMSSKKISEKVNVLSYSPLVLALLFFSISSYVLFTGEVVPGQRKDLPPMNVKIPDYWYEAAEFVNSQPEEFRVLMLPKDEFYMLSYNWGYYGTDVLPRYFFNKPIILLLKNEGHAGAYFANIQSSEFIEALYSGLYTDPDFPLADALSIANVKYVVQRNDVDWTRLGAANLGSPRTIKRLLNGKEGITFNRSFGKLDFYVNEKNVEFMRAYPRAVYIEGNFSDMIRSHSENSENPPVFILNGTNMEKEAEAKREASMPASSSVPTISFVQKDPTYYEVLVRSASEPYWLVFSESYDNGWKLSSKNGEIKEHFVANGYANAWKIKEKGDYSLSIVYEPQKKISLAYLVSVITFAAWLELSFRHLRKRICSERK